jgi:hypothetical protein
LLPIELIIFNCWLTTLYYKATRTAWLWGARCDNYWILNNICHWEYNKKIFNKILNYKF